MTWDDIVTQAFVDCNVIQPGETLTSTLLSDGEVRLNQLLSSLSTEGLTAFQQVMQTFALTANTSAYTLGNGGTWSTTGGLRAQRVTSWNARYLDMQKGGPVLSLDQFGAAAMAAQKQNTEVNVRAVLAAMNAAADSMLAAPVPPVMSEIATALTAMIAAIPATVNAPIPTILAADTSYPLINVRVWPPPAATAGSVEVAYFTPIAAITNFAATVALPPGWEDMLHFNLAVRLHHIYARETGISAELLANAQNSKASIVNQNTVGIAPPAEA